MSERKDLLNKPNTRGFAPIVEKSEGGKGAPKRELDSEHVGDSEPGSGSETEDPHAHGGGDATGQGVEKGKKMKKGMPPGLAAAKEAKEGKPENHAEPDGDEQEEGEAKDRKEGAKGKPPPFMKSVSPDDLDKSIAKLNQFVQEGSPVSRKDTLLEKAQTGELSKSEREELFQILGGKVAAPAQPTVAEQVVKSLTEPSDELQKALDVSDYLQEQHSALVKSLTELGNHLEKSSGRQHEFNLVLAKAMADVGGLVKSLVTRVDGYEQQPARGPKSRGVQGTTRTQALAKGFGGSPSGEEAIELSKSEILDGMEQLLRKSGEDGVISNGESILMAISKYESTNHISKSMLAAVSQELGRAAN